MSKRKSKPRKIPDDPVVLLSALAYMLNACEKAGIRPKMKHGIIYTDAGYVLPVKDRWAARPLKHN